MLKRIANLFNIKVILGAIFFAVGIFAILLLLLWSSKANGKPQTPATAMISIIEPPTYTPIAPMATPTQVTTPASSPQAPSAGKDIAIGEYVQVSGTGGNGLRLHKTASVSGDVQYIAIESEVFLVKSGPTEADGYVWWLLQDPYTDNATGWGVANYLVVVKNP